MTDDLVRRLDALVEDLREGRACWGHEYISAAVDAMDRIEALEAELAKVVGALRVWIDFANVEEMPVSLSDLEAAELTGGKDD